MSINYTKTGDLGISPDGWMVKRSIGGWIVVDAQDLFVGIFETKADAERAVAA